MTNALGHLLIGPPHSGQARFVTQLQQHLSHSHLITPRDRNLANLSATLQQATSQGHPVICDAANAPYDSRPWRMRLLQKSHPIPWILWQLAPAPHPTIAEGYLACHSIDPHSATLGADIARCLGQRSRSLTNRTNRTAQLTFHPYSALLDFDRLLHLISLLTQYPGIGSLHQHNPAQLASLTDDSTPPQDSLSEICAVIAAQRHPLYADAAALTADLHWLTNNHFLTPHTPSPEPHLITLPTASVPLTPPHPYSDQAPFRRLMGTIRFIAHHPLIYHPEQGSLKSLVAAMKAANLITGNAQTAIRKDIEKILKPYQLLPPFPMKRGYFLGTGILSQPQLLQLYTLLRSQAQNLEDPTAQDLLEHLTQQLQVSKTLTETPYPVKTIANRPIFAQALLPSSALPRTLPQLEKEIEQGQLLELGSFSGVGTFNDKAKGFFRAWPIQIVFYNIAWYLGYEIAEGPQTGLLQFQRLDRLFRGRPQLQQRERKLQLNSLKRLQALQSLCYGLYLGKQVSAQKQILSRDRKIRQAAFTSVELWFSDRVFKFVSEGSQRFEAKHMKMSPRPGSSSSTQSSSDAEFKKLYSLPPTQNSQHPHRLRVSLPHCSIDDVDLRRWIIGFGNQVKVIEPAALVAKIREISQSVSELYE